MSANENGYFYTAKNGSVVFVPFDKEKHDPELVKYDGWSSKHRLMTKDGKEIAKHLGKVYDGIWLDKQEYAARLADFKMKLTSAERKLPIVQISTTLFVYTAINFGNGEFKIIKEIEFSEQFEAESKIKWRR